MAKGLAPGLDLAPGAFIQTLAPTIWPTRGPVGWRIPAITWGVISTLTRGSVGWSPRAAATKALTSPRAVSGYWPSRRMTWDRWEPGGLSGLLDWRTTISMMKKVPPVCPLCSLTVVTWRI